MSQNPLDLCKHRWSTLKESYRDRMNWITVQKCRKCGKLEQTVFEIKEVNGKLQTFAETTPVTLKSE